MQKKWNKWLNKICVWTLDLFQSSVRKQVSMQNKNPLQLTDSYFLRTVMCKALNKVLETQKLE